MSQGGRSLKLMTHLHVVARLQIIGAILLFCVCDYVARTGAAVPLPYLGHTLLEIKVYHFAHTNVVLYVGERYGFVV